MPPLERTIPLRIRLVSALVGLVALGALAWIGLSVRRLPAEDRLWVVEAPLLGVAPHRIEPGLRFLPRGLYRLAGYPSGERRLRVDSTGERAAISREGSTLDLETLLTYSIDPDRVADLHRAHGSGYESGWLTDLVRRVTAERVAAVAYEVVRNHDPELPQSLRAALAAAASPDGVRITGVRVTQVAGPGEGGGDLRRAGAEPLQRRVVLIGVDSFTWRIVDPLIAAGRMPATARLVARGARANLRTITPILSPVIWTSIATGMKPSRHGIVDFVVTARDTGDLVPVTSAMRRAPAIWNLMTRQEADVDVVAWWATWPAESVRGRIVTDRVAFQLFEAGAADWTRDDPEAARGKTWPADLFAELRPLIRPPAGIKDDVIAPFLGGGRVPASPTENEATLLKQFRTVVAAGETYHGIARRLLRDQAGAPGPYLGMFYYEGPDTTSHLFMRHRPPLMPGVDRDEATLFGPVVDRYYEAQDRMIGEIVEDAGPDATILLVSDHGFKSDSNRPIDSDPRIDRGRAAEWHTPVGVFIAAGPGLKAGVDIGAASVLDVTPTLLALFGLPAARDMDGQPLAEALDPAFLGAHPIAWIDSYGGQRPADDDAVTASTDDREVIERLRSIGYIGEERLTAQNNRGLIAMDEGDVDGAIAQFEAALAKGAADAEVRVNLAGAWLAKGDTARARSVAEEVLRADPKSKQALAILSGVAIREGHLDEAESTLKRALAVDPTFTLALTKMGEVLQKQGRDDEALAYFEKSVAIAPLSPVEYNAIGNLHRRHARIDRAIAAYTDALRADPQYIGAYNNLGLCLQERGRLDEAETLYKKGLAIRPENPILRNSLATLYEARGRRNEALAEIDRALVANPDWAVGVGNRATLLFELGRKDEALAAFTRWVGLEPENIEARLGRGLSLLAAGKPSDAIAEFGEVLKRDPANLRAQVALGETYLRAGDLDRAATHLEAAVNSGRPVTRAWNSLGDVYARRGETARAASAWQKSLQIDPAQPEIRRRLAGSGG